MYVVAAHCSGLGVVTTSESSAPLVTHKKTSADPGVHAMMVGVTSDDMCHNKRCHEVRPAWQLTTAHLVHL
jgi:hypothetical protein